MTETFGFSPCGSKAERYSGAAGPPERQTYSIVNVIVSERGGTWAQAEITEVSDVHPPLQGEKQDWEIFANREK